MMKVVDNGLGNMCGDGNQTKCILAFNKLN